MRAAPAAKGRTVGLKKDQTMLLSAPVAAPAAGPARTAIRTVPIASK